MRIEPARAVTILAAAILTVLAMALIVVVSNKSRHDEPSERALKFDLALCKRYQFGEHNSLNYLTEDCHIGADSTYTCNVMVSGKPARYTCNYDHCDWILAPDH